MHKKIECDNIPDSLHILSNVEISKKVIKGQVSFRI